ncbi:MAG: ArsB/NhaD family transporter [Candidatus Binatia bacterium]|nr:ArsB/NhaD family transporter [Candidatus Binatia bacterium]
MSREMASLLVLVVTLVGLLLRPLGRGESFWAALGAAAVLAGGLLSIRSAAGHLMEVASVVGFLVAVTLIATLAQRAGVFEALAFALARRARGSQARLFGLFYLLAVGTTTVLSLDATAVLLTPVAVGVARAAGFSVWPYAFATILVANAGSLLLPMSNLTNLLVARQAGLTIGTFASESALPATAVLLSGFVFLRIRYRSELAVPFTVPKAPPIADPALFRLCASVCAGLLPAFLAASWFGVSVEETALGAAAFLLVTVAILRRGAAHPRGLVPWPLVVMFVGLYLVVAAARDNGLGPDIAHWLAPFRDDSLSSLSVTALVAALCSNVANNLPTYLLLAPEASGSQLFAILLGTNVGACLTPIGSLATLLWLDVLRRTAAEEPPSWLVYTRFGITATPVLLGAGLLGLWLRTLVY